MITRFALPAVSVTAPRMTGPLSGTPQIPRRRRARYDVDIPNNVYSRGQFTNLNALHKNVKNLDDQNAFLGDHVDLVLSQLNPADKSTFSGDIRMARQQVIEATARAEQKFKVAESRLPFLRDAHNKTEMEKVSMLASAIAQVGEFPFVRGWEKEFSAARTDEIYAKQKLKNIYQRHMPALNEAYLRKFYPNFDRFPAASQDGARKVIAEIGARGLNDGFLSNKVEILVSEGKFPRGSWFGHVAVKIGGVVYGRSSEAWDIRGREKYIHDQQSVRDTMGYVIQLGDSEKKKLFQSVMRKIVLDVKYGALNNSCSGEIISSFGELGINIVDPRWTIGAVFSPSDIDNFLKRSDKVVQVNRYPKK